MKTQCSVTAPAKINLSLDITGIREDGYHLLETVMQTVDLSDLIRICLTTEDFLPESQFPEILLTGNSRCMPLDQSNTAYKAAKLYAQAAQDVLASRKTYLHSIQIDITKNIPAEAGLAGGSADAAGTLCGLNFLCGGVIKESKLALIALRTGADVPFCMTGGTVLCRGIGEIMTPLADIGSHEVVIYKPGFGISTGPAFKAIDDMKDPKRSDTPLIIRALSQGDIRKAMDAGRNVFENYVFSQHPELAKIKDFIKGMEGAYGAMMSGSGTALYGIFSDSDSADNAKQMLDKQYGAPGCFIARAKTIAGGPEAVVSGEK